MASRTLLALARLCVEQPGDHHAVSANASATEPSRLLAVFVVDTDDRDLTVPDRR